MAPFVHNEYNDAELKGIQRYLKNKVRKLFAVYGYSELFVEKVMARVDEDGWVPGFEEWAVNFIQEKREAKELQEREDRLAYGGRLMYGSQDTVGVLEQILETLRELMSRVSRFFPSAPKKAKTFRMLLQGKNHSDLLRRLHACIDGKAGKAVAMVLLKAKEEKMISALPTEAEFRSEFKLSGTWKGISYYLNPNMTVDISSVAI